MTLPRHLHDMKEEIREYAIGYGLDFFETIFELVEYDRINEIAAFGGFPTRYPHWRFGMEYDQLSRSYEYGLSRIYEMVINTDPAYAWLLEGNHDIDQKTVIAHVYGHVDFFRHNYYFSRTNRKMVDQMANHATRVRRLIDTLGIERVEPFLDTCLALDNLIDPWADHIQRPPARSPEPDDPAVARQIHKLPARDYMDAYINPPEYIRKLEADRERELEKKRHFPEHPQRDVLQFLADNAPLESWELDLLHIVRTEAVYFAPQGMTKIMNEGWATYWHSRILNEKALRPDEFIHYALAYSGVVATSPGQLNPYKLGVELWRDIHERWDRGMFGPEWEHCETLAERERWDRQLGLGHEKIFQIRKLYNDSMFIDEFLTPDFVERQQLYTFGYNPKSRRWEISSRDFQAVKQRILDMLTNLGQPFIEVVDANFRNRGELLLRHRFLGTPLQLDWAQRTLAALHRVWKRPVNLVTVVDNRGRIVGFDGDQHTSANWDEPQG